VFARTVLSFVNLAVLGATLTIWFVFPAYSTYALYACLGWVVAAFVLMYSAWGNRPVGLAARSAPAGSGPLPSRNPSAGGGGGRSTVPPVDFCIYCGTHLPASAVRCGACGHLRTIA